MPGERNAGAIIAEMRAYLKETNEEPYRNGFSTDTSTASTLIPLLTFANAAYGVLARHFWREDFTATMTVGMVDTPLSARAGKIDAVWTVIATIPQWLMDTTTDDLNRTVGRNWRNAATGTPRLYYTQGNKIGVYPRPAVAGNLNYRAVASAPDMTAPASLPTCVPDLYHGAISLLGAHLVALSDVEDAAMSARANGFLSQFAAQYPELKDLALARSITGAVARTDDNNTQEARER